MSAKELIDAARASGDFSGLVQRIPYLQFLGVSVHAPGVLKLAYAPHVIGNPAIPALHGGALAGLLEVSAQLEVLRRAESSVLPKTITLTVDYVRSGKPLDTFVRADVVKHGRRVAMVRSTAWQEREDEPITTGMFQLLVMGDASK